MSKQTMKSPTAGMTLGERIKHVGGRETESGLVEFGSVMAVNALIGHVLRDLPADSVADHYARVPSLQIAIEEALASLESGMVAGAEMTLRDALWKHQNEGNGSEPPEGIACLYVYRHPDGTTQVRAPDIDDAALVTDMLEEALRAMTEGDEVQRQ